jgi:hypothetical protein
MQGVITPLLVEQAAVALAGLGDVQELKEEEPRALGIPQTVAPDLLINPHLVVRVVVRVGRGNEQRRINHG